MEGDGVSAAFPDAPPANVLLTVESDAEDFHTADELSSTDVEGKPGKVKHTDCRSGRSMLVAAPSPTEKLVGNDLMTFVPFALFKQGDKVHTKSIGYHSDGDVVLIKEDISSNSDSEVKNPKKQRSASSSRLTTTHRIEHTLNEDRIAKRGIRAMPGVAGPKGKSKHRRWRNQFFIGEDFNRLDEADLRPTRITKTDFQELFTHRTPTAFSFHEEDGGLNTKWSPFVEVTEEQQAKLLKQCTPLSASQNNYKAGSPLTPTSRWGRISKPLRAELVRLRNNRDQFIEAVEERLLQYIGAIDQSHVDCLEPAPLVLQFDDGYHRMLCHGIVTYYLLNSVSETDPDTDTRYTMVTPSKTPEYPFPLPTKSLLEHISAQKTE
eukprot:gene21386-32890_t